MANQKEYWEYCINGLKDILKKNGIPLIDISFEGYLEDHLCLEYSEGIWKVYYADRGQKVNFSEYNSIDLACRQLILNLSDSDEIEVKLLKKFTALLSAKKKKSKAIEKPYKLKQSRGYDVSYWSAAHPLYNLPRGRRQQTCLICGKSFFAEDRSITLRRNEKNIEENICSECKKRLSEEHAVAFRK